jgi:hypothetical protein
MPFVDKLRDLMDCSNLIATSVENVIGAERVTMVDWERRGVSKTALAQSHLPLFNVFKILAV